MLLLLFMVHIGEAIKNELQRQERSISWFARKLYCDRSNVYDIFKRESIDTKLLLRVCLILNYNFFQLYIEEYITQSWMNKMCLSSYIWYCISTGLNISTPFFTKCFVIACWFFTLSVCAVNFFHTFVLYCATCCCFSISLFNIILHHV